MKIGAYTSSWNNRDGVGRCFGAIEGPTYPIEERIAVDDRSSEGMSRERFPDGVTLRCQINKLGVAGATTTTFEYALHFGAESREYSSHAHTRRPRHDEIAVLTDFLVRPGSQLGEEGTWRRGAADQVRGRPGSMVSPGSCTTAIRA